MAGGKKSMATGGSWGGIEGIIAGARQEPSAVTRRIAENVIYGTPAGWSIEIVRLPLPAAPIGEGGGTGATLSPPQHFPTLDAAIAYARELVQRGYGLHMTGPDGQDWDHRQVVGYINAQAMKRPALRAEDGAKFYGRVDLVGEGQFRASCGARLDLHYEVREEEPEYLMCRSRHEGIDWIMRRAAARGFRRWIDEAPPQT